LIPALLQAGNKLSFEDRVELTRGLTAEYATAKVLLPRSRKALEIRANQNFNSKAWISAGSGGPAARTGDLVQITKVNIEDDRIVLDINGGYNGGKKWYRNLQVGGGMGNNPNMVPLGGGNDSNAPGGTSIALVFDKGLEPIKATEVKKLLAPVLEFEKRSASEIYSQTLPLDVQVAVKEKRALVGMDRDQVILSMGRPAHKSRETLDGIDVEDWVYGQAPGKITFVTFDGDKVIKVKEMYAGLGTQVADPPSPR
jgi:hypothetical protein